MSDIYIKAPVSGWHKATKEQAYRFAQLVVKGAWYSTERVTNYLNKHLLRGVSFTREELLHGN
jgi:hypothetical protein